MPASFTLVKMIPEGWLEAGQMQGHRMGGYSRQTTPCVGHMRSHSALCSVSRMTQGIFQDFGPYWISNPYLDFTRARKGLGFQNWEAGFQSYEGKFSELHGCKSPRAFHMEVCSRHLAPWKPAAYWSFSDHRLNIWRLSPRGS